jgi:hypothetical protein
MQNVTLEAGKRQEFHGAANFSEVPDSELSLTRTHRRLLLGASLRLLGRRFSCGKPILQEDVARVASLADDVMERAT